MMLSKCWRMIRLSSERDEDALNKLNAFIKENSTHNPETGTYEASARYNLSDGSMAVLLLQYTPGSSDVAPSTVFTLQLFTPSYQVYSVSIALDPTDCGLRFDALYAIYTGSSLEIQNSLWGYIEAENHTDTSKLSSYVISGLDEYEDALLADYSIVIDFMLARLDSILNNIDSEISIKDLGFLFYFV